MKRFYPYYFLLGVMLIALMSFAVTWSDITRVDYDTAMKKTNDFYKTNTRYSVKIEYASFRGHDSETPYDESNGFYHRDNNKYQSFLMGIRTIQNDKYKMIIDTLHKSIIVADPQNDKATSELMQVNVDNSYKYITAYKSADVSNGKIYRLEFNTIPAYSAYTMNVTNEGQLNELTIYYKDEYSLDPSNTTSAKTKPKLKITYTDFNSKVVFDPAKEFNVSKYFSEINGKLALTNAFKNYQLSDLRVSKKN